MELCNRLRQLSQPLEPIPTALAPRLAPVPDIRCVLFDVYGTLFISASGDVGTADSAGLSAQALQGALLECGVHENAVACVPDQMTAHIRKRHQQQREAGIAFPEVDIVEIWQEIMAGQGIEEREEEWYRRLAVEYEARLNPVWPMPGLTTLLERCREEGFLMGIVSNAQFYTPLLFPAFTGRTHTEWGFSEDLCIWSYEQGEGKPSQTLFQLALDGLSGKGIAPCQVLYVGNDRRNDIGPAAALGCRTALFAGDARSLRLREDDPRVKDVESDIVCTDLNQIPGCIV